MTVLNLIKETLGTLNEALEPGNFDHYTGDRIVMVFNLKSFQLLISGLLPVAVLMVFIAMKLFGM